MNFIGLQLLAHRYKVTFDEHPGKTSLLHGNTLFSYNVLQLTCIDCGYTLELSRCGGSSEHPESMFQVLTMKAYVMPRAMKDYHLALKCYSVKRLLFGGKGPRNIFQLTDG